MAANMPMAANGQMMMQQQQQAQQQQRPGPMQTLIYQQLLGSHGSVPPNSWQAAMPIQERMIKTMSLYGPTPRAPLSS